MTATGQDPAAAPRVDMGDTELMRDPFTGYAAVREQAPLVRAVMPGVEPVWLATHYDDVKSVLKDPRFVVDPKNIPGMHRQSLYEQMLATQRIPVEYRRFRLTRMAVFDGDEHTRLRGPVKRFFTAQRAARLRPRIEEIVEELLEQLPAKATDGVVDLLGDFAQPLSGEVLCELVGIPHGDRARWKDWGAAMRPTNKGDQAKAWDEVIAYTRDLLARRAVDPGDDLISRLATSGYVPDAEGPAPGTAASADDPLTETEIVAMVIMLGLTSQVTAFFLGNAFLALLTHPGQLALLRADPGLLPRAVDELLRWCTPTLMPPRVRYATEDARVGGMPVRKGEAVCPFIVAANYDPDRFDDPHRLDLTRDQGARRDVHLAFGGGPHLCLGEAVARQESAAAISALVGRHPATTLAADPGKLEYDLAPGQWNVRSVPVRLGG